MSCMAVGLQSGTTVWGPAFILLPVCYQHGYTSPDEVTQEPFLLCSAGSFACLQNSLDFCETCAGAHNHTWDARFAQANEGPAVGHEDMRTFNFCSGAPQSRASKPSHGSCHEVCWWELSSRGTGGLHVKAGNSVPPPVSPWVRNPWHLVQTRKPEPASCSSRAACSPLSARFDSIRPPHCELHTCI